MHVDVWLTKQRVDGNRFVPQRKINKNLVLCSQIVSVNISEHGQLEQEARALVVSDAVDTNVRRMSFLRFGIATQKYKVLMSPNLAMPKAENSQNLLNLGFGFAICNQICVFSFFSKNSPMISMRGFILVLTYLAPSPLGTLI